MSYLYSKQVQVCYSDGYAILMFAIQIRVVFNLKMQQKKSAAHVQAKKERASNQMMYSHGLNTKPILYLKVNGS